MQIIIPRKKNFHNWSAMYKIKEKSIRIKTENETDPAAGF